MLTVECTLVCLFSNPSKTEGHGRQNIGLESGGPRFKHDFSPLLDPHLPLYFSLS